MEFLDIFFSREFIPHGHCYLWKPGLVWLHVISDSLIAIAYYSIPMMLVYFVRKRQDVPFVGILLMFSTFIIACGTTHLMNVWTLWFPTYWLSGLIKAITAFVSVLTAIELLPLIPKALALPSPAQLEAANCQLAKEIAERKRTEEILRESEQRWELALRGNNDGIWDWNVKTNEVFFSTRWKEMLGYQENDVSHYLDETMMRVHPDDRNGVMKAVENHFAKITPFYTHEHRLLCKDGNYKWILDRGQALWDENSNVVRMVGSYTDITERKEAEKALSNLLKELETRVEERTVELTQINNSLAAEITERQRIEQALRESEERFRAAFTQAAVGIAHVGINGQWLLVNQKLCDIFGYTSEELYGRTFQDISYADDLADDLNYIKQILSGEITNYSLEKRYFRKNGSLVWANITVSLIRESTGEPKYFISVVEDISDRKQAQDKIKASLLEKEVLLKEIYHRVKNNLQVISSLLNLQSGYIDNEEYMLVFQQSQQRIASMALVHEKMYRSADLAKINLREYVEDLVSSLYSFYDFNSNMISININIDHEIALGLDTAIPCSLIINELVSNAFKHAFVGRKEGEVNIDINRHSENKLLLIVKDNGIGLPPNFDFQNTASLGWELIDALSSQLSGDINIKSDIGVEFKLDFPYILDET
ncbi:PAS domain S-box protein [Nodularia harveyana UHCC-0300]|uniref:histidine kinase n=1 Tax=Nodularia harveyana UHCC-0300 TaxID=2974287 RepID=A0ABU5U9J1_9CYAN|nr:PAS domain S-box protein [Nodularia harveyana]MEA5580177.1 PAS domain S-box protein [Nodularia harveyana UHCC-0300]